MLDQRGDYQLRIAEEDPLAARAGVEGTGPDQPRLRPAAAVGAEGDHRAGSMRQAAGSSRAAAISLIASPMRKGINPS